MGSKYRVKISYCSKWYDGESFDTKKEMNEWLREWKKYQRKTKYEWSFDIEKYENDNRISYEYWTA